MTEEFTRLLSYMLMLFASMFGCLSLYFAAYVTYTKDEDMKQKYNRYLKISLFGMITFLIFSIL